MRKYGYLVVEGSHDVEFVYRLLSPFGMKRIRFKTYSEKYPKEEPLEAFFHKLIPTSYPLEDGDIQKRMPIPLFLQSKTHAIAIHSAGGDSRLVELIQETNWELPITAMVGVGILLDSDKQISANRRYDDIKQELVKKSPQFELHDEPGRVLKGKPNLGAFVLPDNETAGTLEDLLLESAERIYPCLLKMAKNYVSDAKQNAGLKNSEIEELKNAGENKAVIGAMANIMKPGKSVQVSIQDNNWLKGESLKIERIKAVQDFLQELFELS